MPKDFEFLKSVRFWKLIIVSIAQVMATEGIIDFNIVNGLSLVLLGSVIIRTVDRGAEKLSNEK